MTGAVRWRIATRLLVLAALAWLVAWSAAGLDFSFDLLVKGWPFLVGILRGLVRPAWDYLPDVLEAIRETIQIAIAGTSVGAVLAIPLGFLGATNVGRHPAVVGAVKAVLNAVRTFPELLLAIIFMRGVGYGPFPGVLAMGVHSIGMLGKLYAEAVESIDRGSIEAMEAVGASRVQAVWFGILPQVLPEFASYALYRLEINMRAASVLGMVGAGGIGVPLLFNIFSRRWDRVGMLLLAIIVVVTVIDYASAWLRKRLV